MRFRVRFVRKKMGFCLLRDAFRLNPPGDNLLARISVFASARQHARNENDYFIAGCCGCTATAVRLACITISLSLRDDCRIHEYNMMLKSRARTQKPGAVKSVSCRSVCANQFTRVNAPVSRAGATARTRSRIEWKLYANSI